MAEPTEEKRVNLQVDIVCLTSEGKPHHHYTYRWPNLAYDDLLKMQKGGTKLLDAMNEDAAAGGAK